MQTHRTSEFRIINGLSHAFGIDRFNRLLASSLPPDSMRRYSFYKMGKIDSLQRALPQTVRYSILALSDGK